VSGKNTKQNIQKQKAKDDLLTEVAASGNLIGLSHNVREGFKHLKKSWSYERSQKLRLMAKRIHGSLCKVCNFNFARMYGKNLGEGFIEIHHIVPISMGSKNVNAKRDLIPLCSNCHRMAHRQRPLPIPVAKLREIVKKYGNKTH
jgi:5-methylcytosine-specific restriction protein A